MRWFIIGMVAVQSAVAQDHPLATTAGLTPISGHVHAVTFAGRRAVELTGETPQAGQIQNVLALVDRSDFADGTITVWLTGHVAPNPDDTSSRGFVGIAFRSADDGSRFEAFNLRMTNGRADDQLRRNHAVQYQSIPDYPWYRLREESPGQYESYVDLVPDVWVKLKIEVSGRRARFYVNDAAQPTLIVNDLKGTMSRGRVALWIGPSTVGYFSHLTIGR